jgi:2-dehydro-3-deoxyphosphogluconate aldolase/(4S)-4-hydroxy-2-oxoglutarate aldolase
MKETTPTDIVQLLGQVGIVPVVKIDRVEEAVPLAEALLAGGLPCAEITFRTAAAAAAIRAIADNCAGMLVGAGTVLDVGQAEQALAAGAQFVVSPGFSPAVVDWCLAHDLAVLPGIATPSDVMAALEKGLRVLKFFPAEAYGGIATLKALSAPFAGVKYVPTGGVSAKNMADYLALPAVHAVGGSWMVEPRLIAAGQFAEITRLAAEAVAIARQVRA